MLQLICNYFSEREDVNLHLHSCATRTINASHMYTIIVIHELATSSHLSVATCITHWPQSDAILKLFKTLSSNFCTNDNLHWEMAILLYAC